MKDAGINLTTLQRLESSHLINAQEILMRAMNELAQANHAMSLQNAGTGLKSSRRVIRPHIASGLAVNQEAGITVKVSAGVLFQSVPANLPDVPAAASLDSYYRYGMTFADTDVGDPWVTWHGTDAYWLLEARVVRATTDSAVVDIYNETTEVFAPSGAPVDKRYEAQIEFQWVRDLVSPNLYLPAAPTAGWAPVGWCFRPAVYAAIQEYYIGCMSIQVEDVVGHDVEDGKAIRRNCRMRLSNGAADTDGVGDTGSDFYFDLEAEINGLKVYARTPNGLQGDLSDPRMVQASSVAALNVAWTWGYVYLCSAGELGMPTNIYAGVCIHRGLLIISRVPPDDHGLNSQVLVPPAPMQINIPVGSACHIGYVRSAGVGSYSFQNVSHAGIARVEKRQLNGGSMALNTGNGWLGPGGTAPDYNLATAGPGGTEDIPWGAHSIQCVIEHTAMDAAVSPGTAALDLLHSMTEVAGAGDSVNPINYPRLMMSTTTPQSKEFSLYPRSANLRMRVTYAPLNAALAPGVGGGNNAFITSMIGFTL